MKQKQLERWAYAKPAVSVCEMQTESLLQTFSSQHRPGQHGTGPSSAKQAWLEEEDEDGFTSESEGSYQVWNN